jgi:hypothetical protein
MFVGSLRVNGWARRWKFSLVRSTGGCPVAHPHPPGTGSASKIVLWILSLPPQLTVWRLPYTVCLLQSTELRDRTEKHWAWRTGGYHLPGNVQIAFCPYTKHSIGAGDGRLGGSEEEGTPNLTGGRLGSTSSFPGRLFVEHWPQLAIVFFPEAYHWIREWRFFAPVLRTVRMVAPFQHDLSPLPPLGVELTCL